jgi:polysaccharide transporter, PST family
MNGRVAPASPTSSAGTPLDEGAIGPDRARQIVSGITWSAAYQLFEVAASFASMLILVRIVPPAEYGRAAAAIGLLGLMNTFSGHGFVAHALQTPDDRRPDWTLYWSLASYTQAALFALCHLLAAVCWTLDRYRPIAPLLHVAAFGVLLDAANQVGATMLRREMEIGRLKRVAAASVAIKLAVTISMGLGGFGAYAIIVGGNVVTGLPFGIDLFLLRGWRPRRGWWRIPEWTAVRPAAMFAVQQMGAGLISSTRAACEAAVLPATLGFGAMGLLGRAQALYAATLGRASAVVIDAVYPILPRASGDAERFARRATVFLQVLFVLAIPGGLFVGLEGRALSRVLYGQKWIAMDPLIWPGAIIGASGAVFGSCAAVLLAAGRLKRCVLLDVAGLLLVVPALAVAGLGKSALHYASILAACEVIAAAVAVREVGSLLPAKWARDVLIPPLVAGGCALASGFFARSALTPFSSTLEFAVGGLVFGCVTAGVLVAAFPETLAGPLEAASRFGGLTIWLRRRVAGRARVSAVPPAGAMQEPN